MAPEVSNSERPAQYPDLSVSKQDLLGALVILNSRSVFFNYSLSRLLVQSKDKFCGAGRSTNDLLLLEPATMMWINLTSVSLGIAPTPRGGHGVASIGSRLFVHGGQRVLYDLSGRHFSHLSNPRAVLMHCCADSFS